MKNQVMPSEIDYSGKTRYFTDADGKRIGVGIDELPRYLQDKSYTPVQVTRYVDEQGEEFHVPQGNEKEFLYRKIGQEKRNVARIETWRHSGGLTEDVAMWGPSKDGNFRPREFDQASLREKGFKPESEWESGETAQGWVDGIKHALTHSEDWEDVGAGSVAKGMGAAALGIGAGLVGWAGDTALDVAGTVTRPVQKVGESVGLVDEKAPDWQQRAREWWNGAKGATRNWIADKLLLDVMRATPEGGTLKDLGMGAAETYGSMAVGLGLLARAGAAAGGTKGAAEIMGAHFGLSGFEQAKEDQAVKDAGTFRGTGAALVNGIANAIAGPIMARLVGAVRPSTASKVIQKTFAKGLGIAVKDTVEGGLTMGGMELGNQFGRWSFGIEDDKYDPTDAFQELNDRIAAVANAALHGTLVTGALKVAEVGGRAAYPLLPGRGEHRAVSFDVERERKQYAPQVVALAEAAKTMTDAGMPIVNEPGVNRSVRGVTTNGEVLFNDGTVYYPATEERVVRGTTSNPGKIVPAREARIVVSDGTILDIDGNVIGKQAGNQRIVERPDTLAETYARNTDPEALGSFTAVDPSTGSAGPHNVFDLEPKSHRDYREWFKGGQVGVAPNVDAEGLAFSKILWRFAQGGGDRMAAELALGDVVAGRKTMREASRELARAEREFYGIAEPSADAGSDSRDTPSERAERTVPSAHGGVTVDAGTGRDGALPRKAVEAAVEINDLGEDGQLRTETVDLTQVEEGTRAGDGGEAVGTAAELPHAPIVLRLNPETGRLEPVDGGKRIAAEKANGAKTVEAVVLREEDGWTPANAEAVKLVGNLRNGQMTFGEMVGAFRKLGLTLAQAKESGLLAEVVKPVEGVNNEYVQASLRRNMLERAWKVATFGTEDVAAMVNGRNSEVLAAVCERVNRSTWGEGWQELQLDLARRLGNEGWGPARDAVDMLRDLSAAVRAGRVKVGDICEVAKWLTYKGQSAAEEGFLNPRTEEEFRRVMDRMAEDPVAKVPVEGSDGRMESLSDDAVQSERRIGEYVITEKDLPDGVGTVADFREKREAKGIELRPVESEGTDENGRPVVGCERFPNLRIRGVGQGDKKGIAVSGITVDDLLDERNTYELAKLLGELCDRAANEGISVDFPQVTEAPVKALLDYYESSVKTDRATAERGDVVLDLLEKSRLAAGVVQDQMAFDAGLAGAKDGRELQVGGLTYGYTDGRRVFLNPRFFGTRAGLDTRIHEFGHLGIIACRNLNRAVYDQGIRLAMKTELYRKLAGDKVYSKQDELLRAEEVLANIIGRRGEEMLAKTEPKDVLEKINAWVKDFWKAFGAALGLRDITPEQAERMTLEQVADAIRAEMMSGRKFGEYDVSLLNRPFFEGGKETVFNEPRAWAEGSSNGVPYSQSDASPLRLPRKSGGTAQIVPNDGKKVKARIRAFNNRDFLIDTGKNRPVGAIIKSISKALGLLQKGGYNSNYGLFETPAGVVALRISGHKANGENFGRNETDRNTSVVIEMYDWKRENTEIPYDEFVFRKDVFEKNRKEIVASIMNGVGAMLETGIFVDRSGLAEHYQNNGVRPSRGGLSVRDSQIENPDIRFARPVMTFGGVGVAPKTEMGETSPGARDAGRQRRAEERDPGRAAWLVPWTLAPNARTDIQKPLAIGVGEAVRLAEALTGKTPMSLRAGNRKLGADGLGKLGGGGQVTVAKDLLRVVDQGDLDAIRAKMKTEGYFKSDDPIWAMTATPDQLEQDRMLSNGVMENRVKSVMKGRINGTIPGGNRAGAQVMANELGRIVMTLPVDTGAVGKGIRTLGQGILANFSGSGATPGGLNYMMNEAAAWLNHVYGNPVDAKGNPRITAASVGAPENLKGTVGEMVGWFLTSSDKMAQVAPGFYKNILDAIEHNTKLKAALDDIRLTALGEGPAEHAMQRVERYMSREYQQRVEDLKNELNQPIGTRIERFKDSFVYNWSNMDGPMFLHMDAAAKARAKDYRKMMSSGKITKAQYETLMKRDRDMIQSVKLAQLAVDRGIQNEIRAHLWDLNLVFQEAKAKGVDMREFDRYMICQRVIETQGRSGSGEITDPHIARKELSEIKRRVGGVAYAEIEKTAKKVTAVRERNVLEDKRLEQAFGKRIVDYWKANVHYLRTNRVISEQELDRIAQDRARYAAAHKGGDDLIEAVAAHGRRLQDGKAGYTTWTKALEGSFRPTEDWKVATARNDLKLMAFMERNDYVLKMRDALVSLGVEGVHDLADGDRRIPYEKDKRYGVIRYVEGGKKRALVVPRIIADGYSKAENSMEGWGTVGRIAHGVLIDWNLIYTLRNFTRNLHSNEANLEGFRADNVSLAGRYVAPGVAQLAEIAAVQIARHMPDYVFRNPYMRTLFGKNTNLYYAGQAQRVLELYLSPQKALERQQKAEDAAKRGNQAPAAELAEDLKMLKFVMRGGSLISRFDKVRGGSEANNFMQSNGLDRIINENVKTGTTLGRFLRGAGKVAASPFTFNARFNRDLELFAKITATLQQAAYDPKASAQEIGLRVAQGASIPRYEQRGSQSKVVNYMWNMFFNTALQGSLRHVEAVRNRPVETLGKMAVQSILPRMFWTTMVMGGGLSAIVRWLYDDDEKAARESAFGPLMDGLDKMREGALNNGEYLNRFYKSMPIAKWGGTTLNIAMPLTDEEKLYIPMFDYLSSKIPGVNPVDPNQNIADVAKRTFIGSFVPDITARTPIMAAAQDVLYAWWNNPYDTYRGTEVYNKDLFNARFASAADSWEFFKATIKQGANDLGFRTVLPFARNNIDDGEEAPRAVMKTLRELPLVSSVASGVFRLSTNGYKYQERVIDKMFEQERAVKRLSADRLVREWAKAGQMDPDSSAADKLEEWGKRYGWDESDQTEVLTDAINTWQGRLEDSAEDREWKLFEKVSKLPLVKQEQIERWRTGRMR